MFWLIQKRVRFKNIILTQNYSFFTVDLLNSMFCIFANRKRKHTEKQNLSINKNQELTIVNDICPFETSLIVSFSVQRQEHFYQKIILSLDLFNQLTQFITSHLLRKGNSCFENYFDFSLKGEIIKTLFLPPAWEKYCFNWCCSMWNLKKGKSCQNGVIWRLL